MSKLDELIQQICPDGVEWTRLIDIAYVQYGYPFDSNLFSDDNKYIPLIRIRDVKPAVASTYYSGTYDTMFIIKKGDILVGMDGNFNLERWNDRDGLLNQRVCKICTRNESTVTNGYLYHLLKPLFKKIEDDIEGSTVKHLSAKVINQIYIPLPPLPVQEEIVRLLDQLTETTQKYQVELEAELDVRKKQYEEYRNQLLTFDATRTDVEWNNLCNIAFYPKERIYTTNLKKYVGVENLLKDKAGVNITDCIPNVDNVIKFTKSDILIGNIRPYLKKIWLSDTEGGTNGDVVLIRINSNYVNRISAKYLHVILSSDDFFDYNNKYAKGAKMPRGDKDKILEYPIPIPPLDEQERIVNILDRMDKTHKELCLSIEDEIKMRKQQYEYYRNQLLDFKKKEDRP